MGDRVERLLEVHKAHIGLEWLLVLACLVHQYSDTSRKMKYQTQLKR